EISIIVCACDDRIAATLQALSKQTAPSEQFEVILIDAFESDSMQEEVDKFLALGTPKIQISARRVSNPGRATSNNLGLKLARAPIVVFIAGDFVPSKTFVEAHLRFHKERPDERSVGVGGALFPPELRNTDFRRWLEDSGSLFG